MEMKVMELHQAICSIKSLVVQIFIFSTNFRVEYPIIGRKYLQSSP
jgi:hypothetical protein